MRRLDQVISPFHHPWHARGLTRFVPFARQLYGAYRRCVPSWGLLALENMLRNGLPGFLQRPLEFLLTERLTEEEEAVVHTVEQRRAALIMRGQEKVPYYAHAQPGREGGLTKPYSLEWTATISSVTPYWGTFLFLCTKAHGSRTVLELGSCAGISSCYLASNPACQRLITVEGSSFLAEIAAANLTTVSSRAIVVPASFDAALDRWFPELAAGIDCLFIDGHHEGTARMHYTERVRPIMRAGSLLIWDDIHWTPDLWNTWQRFAQGPGLACAVNVGRFGLAVLDPGKSAATVFDFSALSGYWGKGTPADHGWVRK
jgi:predicted O-methyltransferase YrrM